MSIQNTSMNGIMVLIFNQFDPHYIPELSTYDVVLISTLRIRTEKYSKVSYSTVTYF